MPYDDIRFSGWDDPDDDICPDCGYDYSECACWDDDEEITDDDGTDDEFSMEYECRTCGREVFYIDDKGDCSWCHRVNAG